MKSRLPGFLAILTVTLPTILAVNARAAGVEIKILSNRAFVVSGGTGGQVWHIQYGAGMGPGRLPGGGVLFLAGPGSTAFFTHENWLRRIDVDRGIVTGRWHFPGMRIASLSWKDQHHLHVQVDLRAGSSHRNGRLQRSVENLAHTR